MNTKTTLDLTLANIERAATVIDLVFRNSPQYIDDQLCTALGHRTIVKVETANPIRSFKGCGADFLLRSFDPKQKVICASAGNFGQAVAYAGRSRGIAVEVFVPADVNPMKVTRMQALAAKVTIMGADFEAAKNHARDAAERQPTSCIFVEDGEAPAICEGAGTIAIELLRFGAIDTVVVPLGDGALISGIAMWIKEHVPQTRVV